MAGLIQDSSTNATYGNSAAAMKKGGLRFNGRKPLSDISNKNHISRNKHNRKPTKKVKTANGCPKKLPSFKKLESPPRLLEEMLEEPISDRSAKSFDYSQSPEFHNHEECLKAQRQAEAMEMDYFLKTVGFANGCPKELLSLERPETPPPSLPRFLEMLEESILYRSAKKFRYLSPESLESSDDDQLRMCSEDRSTCFKLLDTPELVKMLGEPILDRSAKKSGYLFPESHDDRFSKYWEDRNISFKLLDTP